MDALDLHSKQYTLRIFGKEKNHTSIGRFIGLASITAMIVISSFFLKVLFQGTQINLVTNYDQSLRPFNNITSLQISLGSAATGNPMNMTGLVNIDLLFYELYLNGISGKTTITPYQLHSCNEKDIGPAYAKGVTEMFLCTPPEIDMHLEGKYGDVYTGGWTQVNIQLNRCDPTKQWCHNKTFIDQQLSGVILAVTFPSNTINHLNRTAPNTNTFHSYTAMFAMGLAKTFTVNLQQVLYDTDQGFVFEDHVVTDFYVYDKDFMNIVLNSPFGPSNLGSISIKNSPSVMKVQRSYTKAQSVLAQIGGMINAILIIGQIIQNFILRKYDYVDLANFLFSFNVTNKNEDNSKIEMIQNTPKSNLKSELGEIVVNNYIPKVSPSNIQKSYSRKLKLNLWELVCFNLCLRKNQNNLNLEKISDAINHQISLETIIEKNFKLGYLATLLLNDSQLKEFQEHRPMDFELATKEIKSNQKGIRNVLSVNQNNFMRFNPKSFQ